MSWLSSFVNDLTGKTASNNAVNAQTETSDRALDIQEDQFNRTLDLYRPTIAAGDAARKQQMALLGLGETVPTGAYGGVSQVGGSPYTSGAVADPNNYQVSVNDQGQFVYEDRAFAGGVPGDIYNLYYDERELYSPVAHANALAGGDYSASDFQSVTEGPYTGYRLNSGGQIGDKTTPTTTPIAAGGARPAQSNALADFEASPFNTTMMGQTDYTMNALTGNAAASGMALSGAHMTDLYDTARRDSNNAFTQYYNALGGISGSGQVATGNSATAGQNFANSSGQILTNQGNALASAYQQQGEQTSQLYRNALGGAAGLFF